MAFPVFFRYNWSDQNSSTKTFTKCKGRRQIVPVGSGNWTKNVFLFFSRNIQYRARLKGPPFSFFGIETFFFGKFPKESPFNFFGVLRQNGCWKIPKGAPFSFFGIVRFFSPKGPPFNFLICDRMDEKPQSVPPDAPILCNFWVFPVLKKRILWTPFAIFEP